MMRMIKYFFFTLSHVSDDIFVFVCYLCFPDLSGLNCIPHNHPHFFPPISCDCHFCHSCFPICVVICVRFCVCVFISYLFADQCWFCDAPLSQQVFYKKNNNNDNNNNNNNNNNKWIVTVDPKHKKTQRLLTAFQVLVTFH